MSEANGYGSWYQSIVATVEKEYPDVVDGKLRVSAAAGVNGFGRFNQTIVIKVALDDCEAASRKLNVFPEHSDDPVFSTLLWTRLARQVGDDEGVMHDLWMELGDLADKTDWHIDWKASNY